MESEKDTEAYGVIALAAVVAIGLFVFAIAGADVRWVMTVIMTGVLVATAVYFWKHRRPSGPVLSYQQELQQASSLAHVPADEARDVQVEGSNEPAPEDIEVIEQDSGEDIESEVPLMVVRSSRVMFFHALLSFGVTVLVMGYVLFNGLQNTPKYQWVSAALVLVVALAPVLVKLNFDKRTRKESMELRKQLLKSKLLRMVGYFVVGIVILVLAGVLIGIVFDPDVVLAFFQSVWDAFVRVVEIIFTSWTSIMTTLLLVMGIWIFWLAWGHFLNHVNLYEEKLTRVSGVSQDMATVYFARVVGSGFAPAFVIPFFRWQLRAWWGDFIIETQGNEENLNLGSHIGEARFVLRNISTSNAKRIAQLISEARPGR